MHFADYRPGWPRVALDAHGNALIAWEHSQGDDTVVRVAVRPTHGAWHAPRTILPAGQHVSSLQVTVAPSGQAAIAWTGESEFQTTAMLVTGLPARGVWGLPVRLASWHYTPAPPCSDGACSIRSKPRVHPNPQVALGAHGEAVAVWEGSPSRGPLYAAVKPAGRELWRAPMLLTELGSSPAVAIDPRGEATVAWTGSARNPSETSIVYCEPAVQVVTLAVDPHAAAKRTRPSSSCSSTSAAAISKSTWPSTSESVR